MVNDEGMRLAHGFKINRRSRYLHYSLFTIHYSSFTNHKLTFRRSVFVSFHVKRTAPTCLPLTRAATDLLKSLASL